MKKLQLLTIASLSLALISPIATHANECEATACVDVYTQDGKIIIEGRKGSGGKSTTVPAPPVTKKPAPPVTKKPAPPVTKKPSPVKPKPPIVKKAAPKRVTPTPQPPVTQSASLPID